MRIKMIFTELLLLLILSFLPSRFVSAVEKKFELSPPPHTSNDVEVTAMMGRWFQMYTSLIPFMTYERSAYCATSDYILTQGPNQNTWAFNITVTQNKGSPDGELLQYTGSAVNPSPGKYPGRWMVESDDKTQSKMFYWIILHGEVSPTDGMYPWIVVTDPFALDLFILARNITTFSTEYESEVLRQIREDFSFTHPLNMPIKTLQSDDECRYSQEGRRVVERQCDR